MKLVFYIPLNEFAVHLKTCGRFNLLSIDGDKVLVSPDDCIDIGE